MINIINHLKIKLNIMKLAFYVFIQKDRNQHLLVGG
nr:hypothetical protein [Gloeochaete wittrockiana]